ncbi:MAG: hypothetical protein JSR96_04505 [Proteobacteria bacterium]|nr:hypothetical protein [Pseudomonadota bacterium]
MLGYQRLIFEIGTLTSGGAEDAGGRDAALAAVSLAFGVAFFKHLGVAAADRPFLGNAVRQLLTQSQQTINSGA